MSRFVTKSDLAAAIGRYRALFDEGAEDWGALLETLMRPLPTWVWANPLHIGGDGLAAMLAEEGVVHEPVSWLTPWWEQVGRRLSSQPGGVDRRLAKLATPGVWRLPPGFKAGQRWWYCAGLAHAQEAVSQLPVTLLDLKPGQRVLDLCAAPGGKTAQIALALGNHGTVVANDFASERIAALQGNLDRLGLVNTSTTRCDGGNYPAAAGAFDRILVDAPCSSEGTLRRNPSLLFRGAGRGGNAQATIGTERSLRMAGRQRALLRKAVQLCRPGGRIVYSTCTFAPEENELVVADILEEQDGHLELLPAKVPGFVTSAGATHWHGRWLDSALARCLRVWPHANDTGGFFVAVLEKSASAAVVGDGARAELDVEPADHDWLQGLRAHYGFSESVLAGYRVHRQTRRGLHLAAEDHAPPSSPAPQGSGLFSYRTNVRPPKLTTGAALLLGPAAQQNRLALTPTQRDRYLRRELLVPNAEQVVDCRPGQVIVTYRGHALGVAVLHRSGQLESLFPSRWSGCAAGA
jgi:NOL1/NOP2/sun family putative RNA methylase